MKPAKLFLLFFFILLISSQNLYSQQCATMKDKFYLGAFQCSFYHPWIFDNGIPPVVRNFPKYGELSFNMMQIITFATPQG